MAKKSKKGESARTETLTVRFSPMLKYGAELLARKHHRTLAGVVEWAVERAVSSPEDGLLVKTKNLNYEAFDFDGTPDSEIPDFIDLLPYLWDTEELGRLHRLAIRAPELMTFEEQKLWGIIRGNAYYWKLIFISDWEKKEIAPDLNLAYDGPVYRWHETDLKGILSDKVSQDLPLLKELVASNKNPSDILPVWIPLVATWGLSSFTDKISAEIEPLVKDQILYPPSIEWQEIKKKELAEIKTEIERELETHPRKEQLLSKIERYATIY